MMTYGIRCLFQSILMLYHLLVAYGPYHMSKYFEGFVNEFLINLNHIFTNNVYKEHFTILIALGSKYQIYFQL
jgi:hypothetical protein